jgi:hypothetical protein
MIADGSRLRLRGPTSATLLAPRATRLRLAYAVVMDQFLRVRLEGEEAELGRVAASDFARLLLGTQSAIQRAAGHVIGRALRETGRPGRVIEDSTRLRLVAIEQGSVIAVLEAPGRTLDPDSLDLTDRGLGELAIDKALGIAAGDEPDMPDVADAFARMADEVGIGRRYDAVSFEQSGGRRDHPVKIDISALERLRAAATRRPTAKDDSVMGVLVEADFESYTARLRGSDATKTQVQFPPELADEIQQALREPARLRGEVRYDPKTSEAREVQLRQIVRGVQLAFGLEPGDFWTSRTVDEIADELGIAAADSLEGLRDHEATDDEVDRMLAALEDQ